jgi:hypothetical protein
MSLYDWTRWTAESTASLNRQRSDLTRLFFNTMSSLLLDSVDQIWCENQKLDQAFPRSFSRFIPKIFLSRRKSQRLNSSIRWSFWPIQFSLKVLPSTHVITKRNLDADRCVFVANAIVLTRFGRKESSTGRQTHLLTYLLERVWESLIGARV